MALRLSRLARSMFPRVVRRDEVVSTNDEAWLECSRGAPNGTVVISNSQTGGRGRMGRRWVSPPGTLCMSILREIVEPLEKAGITGLLAGLAVCRSVRQLCGVAAYLKWPNDVLLDGRKLSGVLVEARNGRQVIGIGVNVNTLISELGPELEGTATTLLAATGRTWPIEKTASAILNELAELLGDFIRTLSLPVDAYMEHFPFVSTRAAVYYANRVVEGTILGVDESGGLILKTGSEQTLITSGEVVHVRCQ